MLTGITDANSIHEVGSTAIQGVIGKQDLEFLVRVPNVEFTQVRKLLDSHFERNLNQLSNDIYQGYIVASDLDAAIQLTVIDGPYDNFLIFLNKFKTESELRNRYNQLKRQFHGQPMNEYQDAKHGFIQSALTTK